MGVLPNLFKLWPWADLDPFYVKVKFGYIGFRMGKSENYLFFGNYCSLRSQSCLMHSAKWINEVEWVSKVKVILWPWSKVTQISKLNVWLLACILRPSLKFCQFAVLRPTRQNRRDPNFFFAISDFLLFFFFGFRALRSYAENRHQRRPRTSKIISVCPDSKGMSYIPISFRMINSCQIKYIKCIS